MSTRGRYPLPRLLRAFALLALVVSLLARPLAIVACDIEDSRRIVAAEQEVSTDSATQDAGGDCCANAACGECCAPAPLVAPTMARLAAYVPMPPQALPEPRGRLEPAAYPVSSRPPIYV
ncbi:hypothetical protein [Pseudoxanthomonas suwonensis]|jgi:hypothetical protein|uniref:hypothetical protein n=1 Tax=Pseudoxanthomonas suwonensis TaxID=314722 RepID=UPI00048EF728|nr:hypothetical protein [Pseudoxanthomonas suwonensis]